MKKTISLIIFSFLLFPAISLADCLSDCQASSVGENAYNACVSSKCASSSASTNSTNVNLMDTAPKNTGLPSNSGGVQGILSKILTWLLGIFGIVALIAFIVSGLQYLFSAGSPKMIDAAKRNMMYAIIGVIVGLAGVIIVQAINTALNASGKF